MAENFDWEKVCVSKFCTVCADFVNYEKKGQETGCFVFCHFIVGIICVSTVTVKIKLFRLKGMKVCQALLQRSPCCEEFLKKSDGGLLRGKGYENLYRAYIIVSKINSYIKFITFQYEACFRVMYFYQQQLLNQCI